MITMAPATHCQWSACGVPLETVPDTVRCLHPAHYIRVEAWGAGLGDELRDENGMTRSQLTGNRRDHCNPVRGRVSG